MCRRSVPRFFYDDYPDQSLKGVQREISRQVEFCLFAQTDIASEQWVAAPYIPTKPYRD